MEVILLKKVENLGNLGDLVSVKSGYGRNFLLPSGTAVAATADNVTAFEARRAELEKEAATVLAAAEVRKEQLEALTVSVACKAGDEGRLFGSVGTHDIVAAIVETGIEIKKNEVRLPNGAFHQIGTYEVTLHLHTDVNATIQLEVVAE